jgi:hypothetical protein
MSRVFYRGKDPCVQMVVRNRRNTMRAFMVACFVVGVIAVGAAVVLDSLVQEPASAAFAESGVRL